MIFKSGHQYSVKHGEVPRLKIMFNRGNWEVQRQNVQNIKIPVHPVRTFYLW